RPGAGPRGYGPSDLAFAFLADADLLVPLHAVPETGGTARRADEGDVGRRHRHVLVDDPGLHGGPQGALVLLGDVDALHDHLALARVVGHAAPGFLLDHCVSLMFAKLTVLP